MQKYYNVDKLNIILHGVLVGMTMYNFSPEVKKRLEDFILYMEKLVYPSLLDANFHFDIIDEKLIQVLALDNDTSLEV